MTPEECRKRAEAQGIGAVLQEQGGKVRVRLPMSREFLSTPVDELNLSVRARNALLRAGLDTVGKLVNYIRENESMTSIRNLGKKSIHEVKTVLTEAAYRRLTEREKQEFWAFAGKFAC